MPHAEEEEDIQMQETITSSSSNDFLYLNEGDMIKGQQSEKSDLSQCEEEEEEENGNVEVDDMSLELLNGQFVNDEEEQQTRNGAEEYENLVKSLTECDSSENFSLIDGNMLETIYSREGLFQ